MQQSPHSPKSQSLSTSVLDSAAQLSSLQQTYTVIPRVRPHTPLLDAIDTPTDLSTLSTAKLITLADELRLFLLYSAGQSGGHFGANLGVVELTIVLHYLLETPQDQIVWDVGHQAYAHKVLTGRREQLGTIRSKDGLTAFPERAESVYDTFGVGHSSTSISAGLGMSLALRYQGREQTVACIIGDGAMTGGMAFEAMNDAVQQDADLLVILNDNDMSISCSIGGFSRHLAMLWESGYQVDISESGEPVLCHRPDMQAFDRRKRHKEMRDVPQLEDNLFKAIGFTYFGPFDGHNIPELLRVLSLAKQVKGPVLVHIYTTKGKGFAPAELDPVGYHAISKLPVE
ncbi:1-deoxy-D-xylulose-5-phosphate synthase N-terminal domain-containing protein, partial [Marinobacter sp. 1Y8]